VNIDSAVIGKIIANKLTKTVIFEPTWGKNVESIVWTLRLPRIILAFAVGAGLSLCGILMQALTKNSLADPYVLGISSGASSGAVCVILFGWFSFAGNYNVMFGATIGALMALVIAMKVAAIGNRITATQLVLAGIAVSAMFSSFTNVCIYHSKTGQDKVNTALYWMLGSLGGTTWEKMFYGLIAFTVCAIVIGFFHKSLDVLMLGDDAAATLGVDLRKTKTYIIILATILTGIIVSISGVIGFVGLVIPHITRSIVGSSHRRLIPAAILVGGSFVIVCDVISRTIVSPQELSIGVVTSFFGAPFFLFLIRKSRSAFGGRQ
jgi:iron complex transport system permease protein